jgi:hypothetical protein
LGFQPFGYPFEISSSLPPEKAKATLRSKKTSLFDTKNGARGWIAGPFICLWFSAFDRYGPMLFGLMSADKLGTRVRGRAGSDLNGVAMFTLSIPLVGWLVFKMVSEGQASGRQLLVLGLVFLVGGPLIYWWAHKERKDAEPLVRFIRSALAQSPVNSGSTPLPQKVHGDLCLLLNGEYLGGPVTRATIQKAFMRVGNRDFLIIESDEQTYLQTAWRKGGYILEVRKGGPSEHYRAVRSRVGESAQGEIFTYEEVSVAMESYVSGVPLPSFLELKPIYSQQ